MIRDSITFAMTKDGSFRCLLAKTSRTIKTIQAQHRIPERFEEPFGHFITALSLLGAEFKDNEAFGVTLQTDGQIREFSGDATKNGLVRAMIPQRVINRISEFEKDSPIPLIGSGRLTTRKVSGPKRETHQSVVETFGGSIAKIFTYYLFESEQIKSSLGLGYLNENKKPAAGGFLIQPLPGAGKAQLGFLEGTLKEIPKPRLLFSQEKTPQELLTILFNGMPFKILHSIGIKHYCPCNFDRVRLSVKGLGKKEIQEMREENRELKIHCDYCRVPYILTTGDLDKLISEWGKRGK